MAYVERFLHFIQQIGQVRLRHSQHRGKTLAEVYAGGGVAAIKQALKSRQLPPDIYTKDIPRFKDKWFKKRAKCDYYLRAYVVYDLLNSEDDPVKWARGRIIKLYGAAALNNPNYTFPPPQHEISRLLD